MLREIDQWEATPIISGDVNYTVHSLHVKRQIIEEGERCSALYLCCGSERRRSSEPPRLLGSSPVLLLSARRLREFVSPRWFCRLLPCEWVCERVGAHVEIKLKYSVFFFFSFSALSAAAFWNDLNETILKVFRLSAAAKLRLDLNVKFNSFFFYFFQFKLSPMWIFATRDKRVF